MDEAKLLQKLRDLEALFAGATTPGERVAAGNARERMLERLRALEQSAPAVEYRFTLVDSWSTKLFLALLRRYELKPYRHRGQRHTTVMVRVPKRFVDEQLWPHYDIEIVHSPLERTITRGTTSVQLCIDRAPSDAQWILEVEDHLGGSTVWDDTFESDQAALEAALSAIDEEGIDSFLA